MMDLTTLAKYPFLNDSKLYVKNNNISVLDLLEDQIYERARIIGVERLDNAFKNSDVGNRSIATESDCIMEILSYPIARMMTVCIDDKYFTRRYSLGEAIHANKNLLNEPTSFLIKISKEFNLNVKNGMENNRFEIYFTDYLNNAPTRYKEWKMVNRKMKNGYIWLSKKDLARIIQEALRKRINIELDNRFCNKEILNAFSLDIKRIKNMVNLHRKKIESTPVGKLVIENLPPCMKDILLAMQSGENVPHMGRFALVAFLNSLKLSTNDILKIFRSAPDFEEEKTRYQVEHITGNSSATSYTPPACDKMRTYGTCPIDKLDELCKKIRHPMNYYKIKWNKNRKE